MKYQNVRYQVAIPWKEDPSNLPSNYDMALKRLKNTEKRLVNDPELSTGSPISVCTFCHHNILKGWQLPNGF